MNEIQIIKEIVEVNPSWYNFISGIVVPLGSLMGVIITVLISNKNNKDNLKMQQEAFVQEINKSKNLVAIEGLNKSLEIYSSMLLEGAELKINSATRTKFNNAMKHVMAYGNADTVNLVVVMQQHTYKSPDKANEDYPYIIICFLALVISQIKFDVTHEIVKPIQFIKIIISDFDQIEKSINESFDYLYETYNITKRFK